MLAAFILLFFFPLNTQQTSIHFEFVSICGQCSVRSSESFTTKGNQNQSFKFGGELVVGWGESGGGVVVGAQVGRVLQGTGQAADAQNGERP